VRKSNVYYVITIFSVLIMSASWIFNLGWYRFVLIFIPIPLIHTIAFLIINIKCANRISDFKCLGKYILISSVTYLLPHLLFPDGGDIGGMYLFFGLIKNDAIAYVMMPIAIIAFVINIIVLIIEGKIMRKCKKT